MGLLSNQGIEDFLIDSIGDLEFEGEPLGQYFISQPDNPYKYSVKWDGEWHITYEVFRDLGIVSYGFSTTVIPGPDRRGVHGNNERIDIESLGLSARLFHHVATDLLS